jgi:hypothetical protein
VDGLSLKTRSLGHALGSSTSRRAQHEPHAQNGVDDSGLADARPPRSCHDFGQQREPNCSDLAFGKGKPNTSLDPWQCLVGSIQGQGSAPLASRSSRSAMVRSAR